MIDRILQRANRVGALVCIVMSCVAWDNNASATRFLVSACVFLLLIERAHPAKEGGK